MGECRIGRRAAVDQSKRTNETGAVIPMLKALESGLANRTFTAEPCSPRSKLADLLIGGGAHYLFAVKGNRPNLLTDLHLNFQQRGEPDLKERAQLRHGRDESCAIRTTATLDDYVNFPHVGQAFLVERTVTVKNHRQANRRARLRHHRPFPQLRQC